MVHSAELGSHTNGAGRGADAEARKPVHIEKPAPTGREAFFGPEEIIVSKTDSNGRITYANEVFCRVAGYSEHEVIGQPHSFIRHPEMPRCIFKLMWDTIQRGEEIFAYVMNMTRNGDHYWAFAHVTPTFDEAGAISGFHSNRRCPDRSHVSQMSQLYRELIAVERRHNSKIEGLNASLAMLHQTLDDKSLSYEQFIFQMLEVA